MKKLIILMIFTFIGITQAQSQHIEIAKNPGEPVIIDFWNLPTDTTTFDGTALEASSQIQGPYSDLSITLNKSDKSATFPAPAVPTFYRLYWFKIVNGVKQKSVSSNSVAIFVVSTGLPTK